LVLWLVLCCMESCEMRQKIGRKKKYCLEMSRREDNGVKTDRNVFILLIAYYIPKIRR